MNSKPKYEFKGYCYRIGNTKDEYRSLLTIKEEGEIKADLLVVMMNPGGFKIVDSQGSDSKRTPQRKSFFECPREFYKEENALEIIPDRTQYRIVHFMERKSLKYALVINLSDIKVVKSKDFYKRIGSEENLHSIFSNKRDEELKIILGMLRADAKVILAWGVNKKLLPLIKLAHPKILTLKKETFGIRKTGLYYYHPLARNRNWSSEITKCKAK